MRPTRSSGWRQLREPPRERCAPSMERVNLFSDTQTRPTTAMRRAMAEAEVGDEQRFARPDDDRAPGAGGRAARARGGALPAVGDDVQRRSRSGCTSGRAATRLILRRSSHPVNYEAGGPAALRGAMLRTARRRRRACSPPSSSCAAVRPAGDRYAPRSRLVSVEQTTNLGGGRVWPLEHVRAVLDVARANGLRAHMDGARLMNAVVASGVPAAEWAGGFDTAWIDFTKGLGAPVGAVLAGSRELIDEAWRYKQMIGGALRQSGIVAAGCALRARPPRRAAGRGPRERARARGRAGRSARRSRSQPPETNIVIADVADATAAGRRALWERGSRSPQWPRRASAASRTWTSTARGSSAPSGHSVRWPPDEEADRARRRRGAVAGQHDR